jgi:hypothetical protein
MGIPSIALTASGWPQVNTEVMHSLAGVPSATPPTYGKLFDFLGGGLVCCSVCFSVRHTLLLLRTTVPFLVSLSSLFFPLSLSLS